MNERIAALLALILAVLVSATDTTAQEYSRNLPPYRVSANVTYVKNGSWEGKIDIHSRVNPPGPEPTMFWIHGGSPAVGTKDNALPSFMSYLELGWNVVNIEPRQLGVTLAPETLQNTLCAVRWAMQNAGVPQKLVTIPGGKHGGFPREENERAYKEVEAFLKANGLTAR